MKHAALVRLHLLRRLWNNIRVIYVSASAEMTLSGPYTLPVWEDEAVLLDIDHGKV